MGKAASTWLFVGSLLILTCGALAIRLPRLESRPMHGDEANQAAKTGLLLETGKYDYDPRDHHGPILYWLTLPSLWLNSAPDLAHSSEFAYRIVPVLFGTGLLLLLFLIRDGIGRPAALIAGLLTAISPAMVYYSRYYVQEMLLVFFTFAALGCAWRYVQSRAFGWALATGACFGLLHTTKETWIIAAVAMGAGLVLTVAWAWWRDGVRPAWREYLRPGPLLAAAAAALVISVAVYSALGRDRQAPLQSVLAYLSYWDRGRGVGEAGIHSHPWYEHLRVLFAFRPERRFFWTEAFIGVLAVVGGAAAFRRAPGAGDCESTCDPQRTFCRFLALYTLVLTALYSAISYKTPWLVLSFLHGMILLAGVGAWTLLRRVPSLPGKLLVAALLLAGTAHLGWEAYVLNTRLAADNRNPYAYAHTSGDVLNLARLMERLAQVSPEGHEMLIHIVTSENYWPLPWYLRQFNRDHLGCWSEPAKWRTDTQGLPPPSVIMLTSEVQEAIDAHLPAAYNQQANYGLRPGVVLKVYVREDLWQAFVTAQR